MQIKEFIKSWGPRLLIILLAALWLMLMASTWADAAENPQDDEYSFNWLDPDKKIYVLQNRRYLKADHAEITLMGGPGLSNPYSTTWNLDPRFSYYFSESFGVEAFYTLSTNSYNNTYKALYSSTSGTLLPAMRNIQSEAGLALQWVPWYAKINVFNKILYFDWYFNGGVGTVNTALDTKGNGSTIVDQSMFAVFLGTGHQYHLTQNFLVRLDLTGAFYEAPSGGLTGSNVLFSNFNLSAGVALKL